MSYTISKSDVIQYLPEAIESFSVYMYEWIDNLHFVLPPSLFLADPIPYLLRVRQRFLDANWDGDGEIGLIWLPPFIFPTSLDIPPVGIVVWHVKQIEDGSSWLLSPMELPFHGFVFKTYA